MLTAAETDLPKRKREVNDERPKKRVRSESSEDEDRHGDILLLEHEILDSKKNYNNIAALIHAAQYGKDEGDDRCLVAALSLCRVFVRLLATGSLSRKKGTSEKDAVVVQWLRDRLLEYQQILREFSVRGEWSSTVLALSMRLLKAEAQCSNDQGELSFPKVFFTDVVRTVMSPQGLADGLANEFVEEYVDEFDDVRFYTFKAISELVSQQTDGGSKEGPSAAGCFDNAFGVLSLIQGVPGSSDELEDFYFGAPKKKSHPVYSVSQHKRQAQEAWLAALSLGLDKEQKKRVLGIVSEVIAPWFPKPELLMDFLTDCYNTGGSTSLLALSGVFYLIREKNLDYPAFYHKLYSLLDADILHSKHRSRFFRLMDTFLASSHLPAQLVASFIKRLSRLCLFAPPSAIVTVVPWLYNLFKSHPQCTFMIHRVPRTQEERDVIEKEGLEDPFLEEEEDPMETHAIDSCLWEVVQLQSHYHPNVATIAKIISEQFTKQSYNLEDFLDHSYASVSWPFQDRSSGT